MKRISRDHIQAAGVVAFGLLCFVAMAAFLLEGEEASPDGWSPSAAIPAPTAPAALGGPGLPGAPARLDGEGAATAAAERAGAGAGEDLAARARERARADEAATADEDEEEGPEPFLLRGVVVGPGGQPVAGAAVQIRRMRRRGPSRSEEVQAGPLGAYEVELAPGRYFAWAEAEGLADSEPTGLAGEPGGEVEAEPLALRTASALSGRVTGPDGRPVEGARVEARVRRRRGGGAEAVTDAEGAFRLDGLAEGLYRVTAEREGFVTARQDDVPVAEGRGGEVELALEAAGRLEGLLRTPEGAVLPGGLVFVYRGSDRLDSTRSGDDGRFTVAGLSAGPVDVFARSDDYAYTCRCRLEVVPGRLTVQDVVLEEGPRIAGVVTDPTGAPLEGVTVRAHGVDGEVRREAESDAEGRYEVEHLYPGAYRLFVPRRDERMRPRVEERVEVSSGVVERDLVVPNGAVVAGVVRGPDGQPLEGAWVFAIVGEEYRGRQETGEDGAYRIAGLDPGSYRVFVRVDGDRLVATSEVEVGRDAAIEGYDLVARAPARLRGRLVDPDGQPLAGIPLSLRALGHPVFRRETTDETGAFDVGPLYDGDYELTADEGALALLATKRGAEAIRLAPLRLTVRDQRDVEREVVVEVEAAPPE